jgi:hypothetical protein
MTEVAIIGVGLASARGGAGELAGAVAPVAMPWDPARRYRRLAGPLVGMTATGRARWQAAVDAALAACGGAGPIVVGSCNGVAESWRAEDWRASFDLGHAPVASAACASGMHALYLARQLIAAGAPEVRVVACDIVTPPCHANFEALRVLSDGPAPFQPGSSGFMLGEAAVALRLAPAASAPGAPRLVGPVLGHDLEGEDGIARALAGLAGLAAAGPPGTPGARLAGPVLGHDLDGADGIARALAEPAAAGPMTVLGAQGSREPGVLLGVRAPSGEHGGVADFAPELVIGQGTGPAEVDRAELAGIAAYIAPGVPLATALAGFGHTLGASSLLSVALAVLARDAAIPALAATDPVALDGRPLAAPRSRRTVVVCRALGGACGACLVGDALPPGEPARRPLAWRPPSRLLPLRDPVLRSIAAAAAAGAHRPAAPPDLVIVTLEAPLSPSGWSGRRILPTSVLEMTPGQLPQLIARAWGYPGPALCLVGGDPGPLLAACRATHDRVYRIAIRGMDERDVEWDA